MENKPTKMDDAMRIRLSDHFSYTRLLKFTLPSIVMMIFTSVYGVVDGFFVSNYVGKTPFAAVNFIMPFLLLLGAVGFMIGTGGSALIAKCMGEVDSERAKRLFSLFVYVSILSGLAIAFLGFVVIRPVASWLGAQGEMLENAVDYGKIILSAIPVMMIQYEFQSFFITAEKPKLGLIITVAAGLTNMALDALLVVVFPFGLMGAAAATAASQCVGGLLPLIYFARPNSSLLRLTKTNFDSKALLKACSNGSSEFLSMISLSIVSMLYNAQLIKYSGEDGVAAYGVLMYVNMVFIAAFIGYSVGTAPVISYHYGAENHGELKSLFRKSLVILALCSTAMFVLAEIAATPVSSLFVGYDAKLLKLTAHAFMIFSFSFLFVGLTIYGSSFFTALNNGLVSALISALRALVFQIAAVLIFPIMFGIDGIWVSIVAAEILAVTVTVFFLFGNKRKYCY